MPIIIAIILALGISSGTVIASQNDLPDEPLYQVKLWSEKVAETLAPGVENKVELAELFAERRGEEIQELLERGPKQGEARDYFVKAVERMTENMTDAKTKLESLASKPDRALEVAAKLSGQIQAAQNVISRIEEKMGDDGPKAEMNSLNKTLNDVEDGVNKLGDDAKRDASSSGLEHSARGIFKALKNKSEEVNNHYQKLTDKGIDISASLKSALDAANAKTEDVKSALAANEFQKAFSLAKDAFKQYVDLGLRLNLENVKSKFKKDDEENKDEESNDDSVDDENVDSDESAEAEDSDSDEPDDDSDDQENTVQVEGSGGLNIQFNAVPTR